MSTWRKVLRIVMWVLGGLLALLLLAAAFLAISIAVDGRGSAARLESVANTTIPGAGGPDVRAYVAKPTTPGPHPAVVMIHEFWGLNPTSQQSRPTRPGRLPGRCARRVPRNTTGYLPRAIYQVVSTPAEEINEDLDAVVAWTKQQPSADPSASASWASASVGAARCSTACTTPLCRPPPSSTESRSPIHNASRRYKVRSWASSVAPTSPSRSRRPGVQAALKQARVESTVTIYPNQPHAFVKNAEGIEAGGAQGAAWSQMLRFFRDALKARRQGPRRRRTRRS